MKAQQLQKQLDAVKAEEAQLLDKAAKAALKVEVGDGWGWCGLEGFGFFGPKN